MQVFLSWSGQKSHDMAKAFANWLPTVLFSAKPWISSADIDKGGTWITSIKDALQQSAGIGIFFVTRDAMASSWLLFEAGSVASLGHQRVCVVYVDVEVSEVQPPLSLFQGTKLYKEDVHALLKSLNKALSTPMEDTILATTFERGWPDLEKAIHEVLTVDRATKKLKRLSTEQVLADIAEATQRIEARLSNLERKALAESHLPAASMAELASMRARTTHAARRSVSSELRARRAKFFGQFSLADLANHLSSMTKAEAEALCGELGYANLDAVFKAHSMYAIARQFRAAGNGDDVEGNSTS